MHCDSQERWGTDLPGHRLFDLKFHLDSSPIGDPPRVERSRNEVRIVLSAAAAARTVDPEMWQLRHRDQDRVVEDGVTGDWLRIRYQDGATFVLKKDGSEIRGSWTPPSTREDVECYLRGPMYGLLLYLRGVTCLHASAIAFKGAALALVGAAEAGKSTLSAAFARNGYKVLTDDILALDRDAASIKAWPGVPRVGLWPDVVESLWGHRDALPRQVPTWEKCFLDLTEHDLFQQWPLPVGAIYVLGERESNPGRRIDSIVGSEAALALIANKYVTRISEREQDKRDFVLLCELAASVPVRRVARSDRLADLNKTCDAILEDFGSRVVAPA